jgi:hypothetical protein
MDVDAIFQIQQRNSHRFDNKGFLCFLEEAGSGAEVGMRWHKCRAIRNRCEKYIYSQYVDLCE